MFVFVHVISIYVQNNILVLLENENMGNKSCQIERPDKHNLNCIHRLGCEKLDENKE